MLMSCNNDTYIEYYPGDNQPIKVTIAMSDGSRVPGFQTTDLTEVTFQASNVDGLLPNPIIAFTKTGNEIVVAEETVNEEIKDIATITPVPAEMIVPVGRYPVFMKLELINPIRSFHVKMTQDKVPLTELVILDGGIV